MQDFKVEQLAYNLAKEFRKHYVKYSFKIFNMHNVKKTKWWPHFIKTAEKYINYTDFDYSFFIKIQFEKHGKILPFFLPGKNAEKTYKDNFYKESPEEEQIIASVEKSKEAIKLWASKHKKDYYDYFSEGNDFVFQQKINYVSLYYLAFSKTFLQRYAKMNESERNTIVSKSQLSVKRALCNQLNITPKIKQIMQEDFI